MGARRQLEDGCLIVDLLAVARRFWRYKLLTLPVVVLTLVAAAYVVAVQPPVYQAQASFVLINPPAPPTAEDIAREPRLGKIKTDNPYTRSGDQSVIMQVLSSTIDGDAARRALVKAGADLRYTVMPAMEFGFATPTLQVTALGATPESAVQTAKIVSQAIARELDRMQEAQGVDEDYRIKPLPVRIADRAQLQASGKLRTLVGVLAFGAILLFIVVSVTDALENLRRERWASDAGDGEPLDDLWPDDPRDDRVNGLNGDHDVAASANGRHDGDPAERAGPSWMPPTR